MGSPKMYTEREHVKEMREAFMFGYNDGIRDRGVSMHQPTLEAHARAVYPLPKVTRPRVINEGAMEWRVVDGKHLQFKRAGDWWPVTEYPNAYNALCITAQRVKLWADLFENPTIEVDADE